MKRVISMAIVLILCFALFACGGESDTATTTKTGNTPSTKTENTTLTTVETDASTTEDVTEEVTTASPTSIVTTTIVSTTTKLTTTTKATTATQKFKIKTGEYHNDQYPDVLIINKVEGQYIYFDVFWYRTAGIDGAVAKRSGNRAYFDYQTEDGYDKTTGYLEILKDGIIELTVTSSEMIIGSGKWIYHYVSEEELAMQYNSRYTKGLLLNNETVGWIKGTPNIGGVEYDTASEVYLRFYEDGTYRYYYGKIEDFTCATTYKEYTGRYRIESFSRDKHILYIDDCAYDFIFDDSGNSIKDMTISRLEKSDIDLSGDYILIANRLYQGLFS